MARTGALIGTVALLALGGYAAAPDDEPAYLGDMPSIIEQGEGSPASPEPFLPPPVEPPGAAERVPAPVTDVPQDHQPGAGDDGGEGRSPFFELPPLPAVP
ncbi:MAG: hypothetical protein ACLGI3_20535 [Actinomycetes bacterium]